jgi:hypothetical protein
MRCTLSDLLYNPEAVFTMYLNWNIVKSLLDQHFGVKRNWESLVAALTVFEIANRLYRDSA